MPTSQASFPGLVAVEKAADITLRDYFAAAAIQGLAERPIGDQACAYVAQTAFRLADAMLKERER